MDSVAIIMPCHNSSASISRAIDSILCQVYDNWVLYAVDDASTDDTWELLCEYAKHDSRIVCLTSLPHEIKGPYYPRNCGLDAAKERFISFLDSDDQWLPNKLLEQFKIHDQLQCSISCSAYNCLNSRGEIQRTVYPPSKINSANIVQKNYIGLLTAMIDTKFFPNPLSLRFPSIKHEDYALWLSLLGRDNTMRCVGIKKVLANYYITENSVSSNKFKSALWTYGCHRHLGYSRVVSIFRTLNCAMRNICERL